MIALVTGATGFIGHHLVAQLLWQSFSVRILTRGIHPLPEALAQQVEIVYGDLVDKISILKSVSGCDIVFHLAGELNNPSRMFLVNLEGTDSLLKSCRQVGIKQVIYLSSVGVMGTRRSGSVDETELCHPQNIYEKSKLGAEILVLKWAAESATRGVVIRPTNVFGCGPRNRLDSMVSWLQSIKSGRFVFFDRQAISNYVYVEDVVDPSVPSMSDPERKNRGYANRSTRN